MRSLWLLLERVLPEYAGKILSGEAKVRKKAGKNIYNLE